MTTPDYHPEPKPGPKPAQTFADSGADFSAGRGARRERRAVQDRLRAAEGDPRRSRPHRAADGQGRRRLRSLRGAPGWQFNRFFAGPIFGLRVKL